MAGGRLVVEMVLLSRVDKEMHGGLAGWNEVRGVAGTDTYTLMKWFETLLCNSMINLYCIEACPII